MSFIPLMQSWIFTIISPVFSVTWSFRNHSHIMICCSRKVSHYYQCWKQLCSLICIYYLLIYCGNIDWLIDWLIDFQDSLMIFLQHWLDIYKSHHSHFWSNNVSLLNISIFKSIKFYNWIIYSTDLLKNSESFRNKTPLLRNATVQLLLRFEQRSPMAQKQSTWQFCI